jgi:transcriptional antiterminator RfaH
MHWYLVHTKPRQEKRALQNLERQGYPCYLPLLPTEKLRQGALALADEPLFPRYLFIQLSQEHSAKSWSPIRSTQGVNRLVRFGEEAAKVDDCIIDLLKRQEAVILEQPQRLFAPGERIQLTEGPFVGIEGVFQMSDGESRVMVLIELLGKPVSLHTSPASLRKAD